MHPEFVYEYENDISSTTEGSIGLGDMMGFGGKEGNVIHLSKTNNL